MSEIIILETSFAAERTAFERDGEVFMIKAAFESIEIAAEVVDAFGIDAFIEAFEPERICAKEQFSHLTQLPGEAIVLQSKQPVVIDGIQFLDAVENDIPVAINNETALLSETQAIQLSAATGYSSSEKKVFLKLEEVSNNLLLSNTFQAITELPTSHKNVQQALENTEYKDADLFSMGKNSSKTSVEEYTYSQLSEIFSETDMNQLDQNYVESQVRCVLKDEEVIQDLLQKPEMLDLVLKCMRLEMVIDDEVVRAQLMDAEKKNPSCSR